MNHTSKSAVARRQFGRSLWLAMLAASSCAWAQSQRSADEPPAPPADVGAATAPDPTASQRNVLRANRHRYEASKGLPAMPKGVSMPQHEVRVSATPSEKQQLRARGFGLAREPQSR